MKTLTVRKEAESDISDAYNWYENKSVGLGGKFVQSVEETFSRISFNPLIYPSVHKKVRRAFTQQFPFGVFYSSSNKETNLTKT